MSHRELKKKSRPPGGGRFLKNPAQVYDYNNWDNVEWDEEQELEARRTVEENSNLKLDPEKLLTYEIDSAKNWDNFYGQHQNKFFKDRHWLFTEFPELETLSGVKSSVSDDLVGEPNYASNSKANESLTDQKVPESYPGEFAKTRMLEVGCGVGNTVFPVLETNNDPELFMYCCDLSDNAIHLVKTNKDYNPQRCHAFVFDVTDAEASFPFPDESLDIVVLIFVLSAINPEKFPQVIGRLKRALKPGGLILFRDYGRYDLTQLRFKKGRCLGDNFYVRGDGTKVYFFTQEELRDLFAKSEGMIEEQNIIDRRLQVNRGRQIKMYRVWIQCKYRKPKLADQSDQAGSAL